MEELKTALAIGQVWSLKRCSNKAVVRKIETIGDARIVHVSITNSDREVKLGHAPFDRATFLKSVDQLLSMCSDDADFREGYAYWRSEFERGVAGVFSIDACELI